MSNLTAGEAAQAGMERRKLITRVSEGTSAMKCMADAIGHLHDDNHDGYWQGEIHQLCKVMSEVAQSTGACVFDLIAVENDLAPF